MAKKILLVLALLIIAVLLSTNFKNKVDKSNWVTFKSDSYIASYGSEEVKFSIMYPSTWKQGFDDKGFGPERSKFGHGYTFSKEGYEIRIALGYAPGGNLCVFDDSKGLSNLPQSYSDLYHNQYVEIKSNFIRFRRITAFENSGSDYVKGGFTKFALCGENEKVKELFSSNTTLGKIEYTVPTDYISSIIIEMDSIISTLQRVK